MTTVNAEPVVPNPVPMSQIGRDFRAFEHDGFYDFILRAQQEEPVFYAQDIGHWVVTRREDVKAILSDAETFSASATLLPVTPLPKAFSQTLLKNGFSFEPTLVNSDGAGHQRLRKAATRFLNVKRFQMYEDDIRAIVRTHIAEIGKCAEVDLVEALTYDVPAKVLALLLGIDDISPRQIKTWADHRLLLTFGALPHDALNEAAEQMLDYWHYCGKLVEDRITNPKDDYASALLAIRDGDDDTLTLTDIQGLVFGLMLAGHETTTNASGNLIYSLLQTPDQWRRIADDPSLVGAAVEEGLRFASSVVNWRRRTTRACQIGAVDVPKGALVLVSLAGANNDPTWHDCPRVFDLDRANVRQHFAFGQGPHHCIGAPLARLELKIILEELTFAFPNMRLSDAFEPKWLQTATFRGLERLDVMTGL